MIQVRTAVLSFLMCGVLAAEGKPLAQLPDDPTGRNKANLEWFGVSTPDYLDFKAGKAREEVTRWGRSFPAVTALAKANAARIEANQAQAATASANTWMNLGPFTDQISGRDVDAGRPSGIVALAGNVLLLATSGGGVFRCANADPAGTADWVWQAVTDSLPASSATGNEAVGCLAASPDGLTVFLGLGDDFDATGRGVYRSTDQGATWTVSAVAGGATRAYDVLPLASGPASVVLLGTDDGLKRSVDGGATFAAVPGPLLTGNLWSLRRLSATDVLASRKDAAGSGTLYWSADAGATWTLATLDAKITGLATGTLVLGRMTLATSPASATQAWGLVQVWDPASAASSTDNVAQGLLSSADKGRTWTFVAPASPLATGTLFKGTGNSMATDGGQGFYNQMIAVSPTDSTRLVVGANLATYRTLDGGRTWSQLTEWTGTGHPYAHADSQCHTWSPDHLTLYVGNDGGLAIFKQPWAATIPTADDPTFVDSARNKGIATHLVYHLGSTLAANVADGRWRISLGCQDDGTRIRQGSGTALQTSGDFTDTMGGDGFGTLFHPADANQVLASIYRTEVWRSTNGGASFNQSIAGITEAKDDNKAPFITRLVPGGADTTGNTVFTFTNGTVYKSRNFGATWAALGVTGLPAAGTNAPTDPANALYIRQLGAARSDPAVVGLAANGGRVYLTADSGATWTAAGALPNNGLNLSYLSFDPLNARTLYVASVAPGSTYSHLWKSQDAGATFTSLDGSATASNGFPWGIPVHLVAPDPKVANRLFAGTDFGVYQSPDGGATWSRLGTGLPLVAARDLYLAPDGSFIRAATYGRGVWELTLGAQVTFAQGGATTLLPSASTPYTAMVTGATNTQVAWSDGGAGGTFTPATTASGGATTYKAPAAPALVVLTAASVEQPASTAILDVTVYNPAALVVAVSPATHVLTSGASTTYQATVTGAPPGAVTWTCSAGTITAAGVFTAPTVLLGTQSVTITATSAYAGAGQAGTATAMVKSLDLDGSGSVGLEDLAYLAFRLGQAVPGAKLTDGSLVDDGDLAAFLARF
jgi:hypothetical protein